MALRSLRAGGEHRDLVARREPGGEQPQRVRPVERELGAAQTADVELAFDALDGRSPADAARFESRDRRRRSWWSHRRARRAVRSPRRERPDLAVLEVEVHRAEARRRAVVSPATASCGSSPPITTPQTSASRSPKMAIGAEGACSPPSCFQLRLVDVGCRGSPRRRRVARRRSRGSATNSSSRSRRPIQPDAAMVASAPRARASARRRQQQQQPDRVGDEARHEQQHGTRRAPARCRGPRWWALDRSASASRRRQSAARP